MRTSLPYQNNVVDIYIIEPETKEFPLILFLHGGSKTLGKERFQEWQDNLAKEGIGSASFDFIGVGKSTGSFSESSLADRVGQVIYIVTWLHDKYPQALFSLYGVSMGGYVALAFFQKYPFTLAYYTK